MPQKATEGGGKKKEHIQTDSKALRYYTPALKKVHLWQRNLQTTGVPATANVNKKK